MKCSVLKLNVNEMYYTANNAYVLVLSSWLTEEKGSSRGGTLCFNSLGNCLSLVVLQLITSTLLLTPGLPQTRAPFVKVGGQGH